MPIPVNRAMFASQAAAQNRSKIDSFPANIGPHGMLMVFKEYVFQQPTTRTLLDFRRAGDQAAVTQSRGAVLLPIPNTLTDATSLEVTRFSMLNDGGFGYETVAKASAAIGGSLSDAANPVRWGLEYQDALTAAKKLFGENFMLGAVSQGLGVALNPKASLLFRGVDLREYTFDWTLAPTEEEESRSLRAIVNKIKANALPTYRTESIFTAAMLEYPATVDIYLLGIDPDYYIKFKTAMIRSVSVNYAPNGLSILRGGRPSSVTLSVNLQEMDIQTAYDYNGLAPPAPIPAQE